MSPELPRCRKLLSGWGRTAPTAAYVETPALPGEIPQVFSGAGPRGAIPRGLGRSYGDAAQNAGGIVADMTGFSAIKSFEPEHSRVTVEAGLSIERLMAIFIPRGWFPPVVPGTRHVTIGGAIAADIHGKNHHFEGSFANHVQSLVLEAPNGRHHASPDSHADIFWATAGGMGLTGIVTEATLDLLPIETAYVVTDTCRVPDLDECMARLEAQDDDFRYSVAWVDSLATGADLGRAVLMRGDHAPLEAARSLDPRAAKNPLAYEPKVRIGTPPWLPNGLVNKWSIKIFNELWYRKAPAQEHGTLESIETFFHPLDAFRDWNRLYGSRGFLQYQFVVPFGAESTLRTIIEQLARARAGSPVTVLKRLGSGNPGGLSFPQPGWTLTLDISASVPGLATLLDDLDQLVLGAGGRLYLAKDSRAKAETLVAMYPGIERWREVRDKLDPTGVLQSDLARRLELT